MKLVSTKFTTATAENILAYLSKSGTEVSSTKISQGIALAILDDKRPANSGTLKKYVRTKCSAELTPHAFSVAVAYAALNGTGVGHVEEEKFLAVPLNWHLETSAIVNLVSDPEKNLDDAARAAVHEEISEIYRTKPDKGQDLLKLIKARYKPAAENADEKDKETADGADGKTVLTGPLAIAEFLAATLTKDGLKAIGLAAAALTDLQAVQRTYALLASIDLGEVTAIMAPVLEAIAEQAANLAPAEVPAASETPAVEAPAADAVVAA